MKLRHPDEMKSLGFTIDESCYPWVAYKGKRFNPTEWHQCFTESESKLLRAFETFTNNIMQAFNEIREIVGK